MKKQKGEVTVLQDDKKSQGISGGDENGNISWYKSKKLGECGTTSAAVKTQREQVHRYPNFICSNAHRQFLRLAYLHSACEYLINTINSKAVILQETNQQGQKE